MLQNIRNNIQGTMAKVVIAIIIVPFAFFGIDSLFGSGGPSPVARVNGQAITEVELNNAISLQQRQILAMMDGRADPELLDQSRLREPVLQRMIREQAVEDHARRIGMVVSEQSVNENIVALPQFRENGRFSVDRYRNLLRAQGLNPGTFKEELRSELLRLQLQQGIVASSLQLDRELADVARLLEQSRSFSYSIIDVAALAAEMEPDEEQLRAFHRSHGERFERPEQVRLSYIDLRADHLLEPVDEEELAAELARLEASAEQDTLRHAAHILIEVTDSEEAALEQAEALREQLDQGADFADLAQRHSADPGSRQQGGELGASSGDLFPEPFERALAELEPGEVSAPVRTESGYHLIRLLAVEEGEGFDQDERLAEVREQLQRQAAEHRLIALVETLRDLSFNAKACSGLPGSSIWLCSTATGWRWREAKASGPTRDCRLHCAAGMCWWRGTTAKSSSWPRTTLWWSTWTSTARRSSCPLRKCATRWRALPVRRWPPAGRPSWPRRCWRHWIRGPSWPNWPPSGAWHGSGPSRCSARTQPCKPRCWSMPLPCPGLPRAGPRQCSASWPAAMCWCWP